MIHPIALRLNRVTGVGSLLSAFLHILVANERRAGWRSSKSRLLRGVAAFEGVSSGVIDDDPLVAIWSLLPPTSRSTGATVAVAALFAMSTRSPALQGSLEVSRYHYAQVSNVSTKHWELTNDGGAAIIIDVWGCVLGPTPAEPLEPHY